MGRRQRFDARAGLVLACMASACAEEPRVAAPPLPPSASGGEGSQAPTEATIAAPVGTERGVAADVLFPSALRDGLLTAVFSPDGKTVAMAGNDGSVTLVDAASGLVRASRRMRVRGEGGLELAFRDGGRTLLVATLGWDDPTDDVLAWDLDRDAVRTVVSIDPTEGEARGVALSPDGAFAAFSIKPPMREGDSAERPARVAVFDTADGRRVGSREVAPNPRLLTVDAQGEALVGGPSDLGPAYAPATSRDARRVALSTSEDGTVVLDASTGERLALAPRTFRPARGLRLSPSGTCLAAIDTRGELLVLPAPGRAPLRAARSPGEATVLEVADDCASVLVLTTAGGLVRRHGARLERRETVLVDGSVTHVRDLEPGTPLVTATSPDGALAAVAIGSHLTILDLAHHLVSAYVDENGSERSLWQARFEGTPERLAVRGRNWGILVSATTTEVTEAADVDTEDEDEAERSAHVPDVYPPATTATLLVSLRGSELDVPLPDADAHGCSDAEYAEDRCSAVRTVLAPDDAHVAVVDRTHRLFVVALPTEGREVAIAEPIPDVARATFSDDGSSLLLERSDGTIAHLRLGGSPTVLVPGAASIAATTLDESAADVRFVAFRLGDRVQVFDARAGLEAGATDVPSGASSLAVDAEGRAYLAYASPERTLVFDAAARRSVLLEGRVVGVSPGLAAIASCAAGRLYLALAPTAGGARTVELGECGDSTLVGFRADGAVAAIQGATTVDLVRVDGSARARLRFHRDEDHVTVVAVDSEGRHLVMPAHARDFTVRAPAPTLREAALSEPDPARVREELLSPFFTP
ncbi:MAG: hypothetical protein U0230_27365 [Polyangiales bacterium]